LTAVSIDGVRERDAVQDSRTTMWLVLLETSGNQAYIFDTNRRRENVGASHLIASLGDWARDALTEETGLSPAAARLARGDGAELLTEAAGRVQIIVRERAQARALIAAVTGRAMLEAPGLDVCGVSVDFAWSGQEGGRSTGRPLAWAIAEAERLLAEARRARPAQPSARFPRLPLADQCGSSPMPAAVLYDPVEAEVRRTPRPDGAPPLEEPGPRSLFSWAKLYAVDRKEGGAHDRLAWLLTPEHAGSEKHRRAARDGLENTADRLQYDVDWVGVVHADGNGLGKIFQRFTRGARERGLSSPEFADALRALSAGVDEAARRAYRTTIHKLAEAGHVEPVRRDAYARQREESDRAAPTSPPGLYRVPVLPLVVGGDDLTVLCKGQLALDFTAAYLRAFEEATGTILTDLAGELGDGLGLPKKLTAKAGVAIVKRHYPFFSAYGLAEQLMSSEARLVKTKAPGSSALAFHVLYDSAATSLPTLRARQSAPADDPGDARRRVILVAQPYLVTEPTGGWDVWSRPRRWDLLRERVDALLATADDSEARKIPRSQAHDLRAGLFLGRAAADARLQRVRRRYEGLDTLAFDTGGGGTSLFTDDGVTTVAALLDAMDAEEFLGGLPDDPPAEARAAALGEPEGAR